MDPYETTEVLQFESDLIGELKGVLREFLPCNLEFLTWRCKKMLKIDSKVSLHRLKFEPKVRSYRNNFSNLNQACPKDNF